MLFVRKTYRMPYYWSFDELYSAEYLMKSVLCRERQPKVEDSVTVVKCRYGQIAQFRVSLRTGGTRLYYSTSGVYRPGKDRNGCSCVQCGRKTIKLCEGQSGPPCKCDPLLPRNRQKF